MKYIMSQYRLLSKSWVLSKDWNIIETAGVNVGGQMVVWHFTRWLFTIYFHMLPLWSREIDLVEVLPSSWQVKLILILMGCKIGISDSNTVSQMDGWVHFKRKLSKKCYFAGCELLQNPWQLSQRIYFSMPNFNSILPKLSVQKCCLPL